jgi:hypothetical protein
MARPRVAKERFRNKRCTSGRRRCALLRFAPTVPVGRHPRAIINRPSSSPCRPECARGTRSSRSRHRSRGVAHVSGAPRHGATGPPAARVPGPRTARSVDIPLPTRGATSAPARCDRPTPGPGRYRRTPRPRITRAGARATRRGAPRSCVTPRERCHKRQCSSASPCRPGCPQGPRSGGLR